MRQAHITVLTDSLPPIKQSFHKAGSQLYISSQVPRFHYTLAWLVAMSEWKRPTKRGSQLLWFCEDRSYRSSGFPATSVCFPESFPVPEYSSAIQQMITARQTAEVTFFPLPALLSLSLYHFLSLLKTEEMKQALHVKRSQMAPLGAARWLSVEVKTVSRPIEPKSLSRGSPSHEHTACTPAPAPGSALGRERGVSADSSRGLDWWERAGKMTKQS